MCPHCAALVVAGGIVSIPIIPVAFRALKDKLSFKKKATARQEAMKANFDVLYGKPDMGRANPGYVAFQKAMRDDDAT